jgi:hypothetical protein
MYELRQAYTQSNVHTEHQPRAIMRLRLNINQVLSICLHRYAAYLFIIRPFNETCQGHGDASLNSVRDDEISGLTEDNKPVVGKLFDRRLSGVATCSAQPISYSRGRDGTTVPSTAKRRRSTHTVYFY